MVESSLFYHPGVPLPISSFPRRLARIPLVGCMTLHGLEVSSWELECALDVSLTLGLVCPRAGNNVASHGQSS